MSIVNCNVQDDLKYFLFKILGHIYTYLQRLTCKHTVGYSDISFSVYSQYISREKWHYIIIRYYINHINIISY